MKIVFLGSPEFAIPSLDMLVDSDHEIAAVFTQPDKPRGRGKKMQPTPVKVYALEKGLRVIDCQNICKEGVSLLKEIEPELMVTVAYGQLLSEEVLSIPTKSCINVHGSLLPKLRGAAPIEWSIINGDTHTGVTTMYTIRKLDAGDILESDEVEIDPNETGGQLRTRLADVGAGTLKRTLEKLEKGTLVRKPQDEEQATYSSTFSKDAGKLDFTLPPTQLINLVRGLNPSPIAFAQTTEGIKIKVYEAALSDKQSSALPGTILYADAKNGLVIQAGGGALELVRIQTPGGKPMLARDYLRGHAFDYVFNLEVK